ncbi:50S ribosomal protein L32 [Variovorax sp. GB1R11]|uniref:50S ribosomal protein L32 n=1 Tax=Variovorax sp. GB1R11 TaxID=3443741 RepID=UPI003F44565C
MVLVEHADRQALGQPGREDPPDQEDREQRHPRDHGQVPGARAQQRELAPCAGCGKAAEAHRICARCGVSRPARSCRAARPRRA